MQGIRLPDTPFGEIVSTDPPPGSYWKVMNRKDPTQPFTTDMYGSARDFSSNLTGFIWGVITPNGLHGLLTMHTVREEEDGTISVRPGDGSSNSILIQGATESWHGYIEHGVWSEC